MEVLLVLLFIFWFIICVIGLSVDGQVCSGATLIVLVVNTLFSAFLGWSIIINALASVF